MNLLHFFYVCDHDEDMDKPLSKGERTREAMAETAAEIILNDGIHALTFSKVTTRLGLTQAAIYKHHANLNELIADCIQRAAIHGRAFIDERLDGRQNALGRLRQYVELNFEWVAKNQARARVLFTMFYLAPTSRKVGELYNAFNQASLTRLEDQLHQGAREGLWPTRDLESITNQIHELLVGSMIKSMNEDRGQSWKPRAKRAANAITLLASAKK